MKWIKASERMPPTGIKIIVKDKYIYVDIARIGWDKNFTDYEWLDESAPDDNVGGDAIGFANFIGNRPLSEYSKSKNKWRWWSNEKRQYEFATTEELYNLYLKSKPNQP